MNEPSFSLYKDENGGTKRDTHRPLKVRSRDDLSSGVTIGDDDEERQILMASSTLVTGESTSVLERGRCPYEAVEANSLGPSEQALYGLVVHAGKLCT